MRMMLMAVMIVLLAACGTEPDLQTDSNAAAPAAGSERDVAGSAQPAKVAVDPPAEQLRALPDEQYECHGTFHGERFWARLGPRNPEFGGGRILKLVYTQPGRETLGGSLLDPHPWLLLNDELKLMGWNERSRQSAAQFRADLTPPVYAIQIESERLVGDETFPVFDDRKIDAPASWSYRLAPIKLLFAWQPGSEGAVRLVDVFGPRHAEELYLSWKDTVVDWAGTALVIEADAEGRIAALRTADGEAVVTLSEWSPVLPAAEALARDVAERKRMYGE